MTDNSKQHDQLKADRKLSMTYAQIFSTPAGQRVLKDLADTFSNVPLFDPANPDPYVGVYRNGRRDVVMFLIEMMEQGAMAMKEEILKDQGGKADV